MQKLSPKFITMSSNAKLSIWVVAMALWAAAIAITKAENIPSCATNLAPCLAYLNSTSKPSLACCIPLKVVIENQLQCLCDLYNTTELNGGNVTQAISLAARCGVSTDLSVCGIAQPPGSSASPSPIGLPGTPTVPSPSGAEKIASSAGFLGVVFLWVSIIFY